MSSGSGLKLRSGIHFGRVSHGVYSQLESKVIRMQMAQ